MTNKNDKQTREIQPQNGNRNILSLRDAFNRLFDESVWDPFDTLAPSLLNEREPLNYPQIDMSENDKQITVTANLPGVNPDQVSVEAEDDFLVLSGSIDKEDEEEDKDRHYYRYEREYGEFRRSIPLPSKIDKDNIKARFKNGVLTIDLPKLPEEQSGRSKIKIETE